MILFFDACALIYLIEGAEPFASHVRTRIAELARANTAYRVAISRLSCLECRVGPMKTGDTRSLDKYDAFFNRPDVMVIELTPQVVDLATAIRVRHGLRTPDALQAASCLQAGPEHLFLTGDISFERVHGLHTALLNSNQQ